MGAKNLQLMSTPQEYFHDRVLSATSELNLKIDEALSYYLVELLCEYISPPEEEKSNSSFHMPLALILKKATEAPPSEQLKLYKKLGDFSLYFSGFFQEFFNRKTYDVEYYINIGSTAYSSLSAIMRDRWKDEHFSEVYQKLSKRFPDLVDVVSEVSEVTHLPKEPPKLLLIKKYE